MFVKRVLKVGVHPEHLEKIPYRNTLLYMTIRPNITDSEKEKKISVRKNKTLLIVLLDLQVKSTVHLTSQMCSAHRS